MAKEDLKAKLREALVLTRPQIKKDYLYDRCVNSYVDGMLIAIRDALAKNTDTKCAVPGAFALAQKAVAEDMGKLRLDGKQKHIYYLMREFESTSLITEIHAGFNVNGNRMLSVVKLNDLYKDLLMEELLNLNMAADTDKWKEIEGCFEYKVDVDTASLRSYLERTRQTIRDTDKGQHYKDKLLTNLAAAQRLLANVQCADDSNASDYVREQWRQEDCGRIYGHGHSLQSMAKEVRHAALGVCNKYDFKASAFALMAGLAHDIDPTLKLGATLDYVKNRQKIRKRIAMETGIDVVLVKEIFTALGFGAELKNNVHNAIRGALAKAERMQHDMSVRLPSDVYNNLGADEYMRLTNNQTFKFIYDELQLINATILQHCNGDNFEICGRTYNAINPKTGKKRNSRQKLAFIYQAMESYAMLEFTELVEQKELLTTHDCVYYKLKLSSEQVMDITLKLQEAFKYLRFEHEKIYPITTQEHFDGRFADQAAFEKEHAARIADDEELAKMYSPILSQLSNMAETECDRVKNERLAWQQFARDVGLTKDVAEDTERMEKELWG